MAMHIFLVLFALLPLVHSQAVWEKITARNSSLWPAAREDASASSLGETIFFLTGGCVKNCSVALTDTWLFDITSGEWYEVPTSHQITPARWGAAATALSTGDGVLVFGGTSGGVTYYNDLWLFNNNISDWQIITAQAGTVPSVRAWAVLITVGAGVHNYALFGGDSRASFSSGFRFYNDIDFFSESTKSWNRTLPVTPPSAVAPPGVAWTQAAPTQDFPGLVIFGGCSAVPCTQYISQDVWVYDAGLSQWTQKNTSGPSMPQARFGGNAFLMGDKMLVFGGLTSSLTVLSDLWALSLSDWKWALVSPLQTIFPRAFAASSRVGFSRALVFGGSGLTHLMSDLWLLSVPQLQLTGTISTLLSFTVSSPITILLPSPVPVGKVITIVIRTIGSKGAVVSPNKIELSSGDQTSTFTVTAGVAGSLLVTFALEGPAATNYVAPNPFSIFVKGSSRIEAPSTVLLGDSIAVFVVLSEEVPYGNLQANLLRSGAPAAAISPQSVIISKGNNRAGFWLTTQSTIGNLSIECRLTGPSQNIYFIAPIFIAVQGNITVTSYSTLTKSSPNTFAINVIPAIALGQHLHFHVRVLNGVAEIVDSNITFTSDSDSASFSIIPSELGIVEIGFSVSGSEAAFYRAPPNAIFTVQANPLMQVSTRVVVGVFVYFCVALAINFLLLRRKSNTYYFTLAVLLWLFFGLQGTHRFYLKNFQIGGLYIVTWGVLGIGWIIDIFILHNLVDNSRRKSSEMALLQSFSPKRQSFGVELIEKE